MPPTEWRETELGAVAIVSWGDTTTTKAAYTDAGFVAYSASGPDGRLPYADHHLDGVVVSAIGAQCGKTWFATGDWSCIKNTMWLRSNSESVLTRYLYFATGDPSRWPRRGAAQPFIALTDAKQFPLLIPDLRTQRIICRVLGSLDDLIENNTRRIGILEEMAQAIYREWFVEFRYPGHEDVSLVDSDLGPIPEGWEAIPFIDLGEFLNGFAFKPAHLGTEGLPVVKIKELRAGVTAETPRCPPETIDPKFLIANGDVLFSWSAYLDAFLWCEGAGLLNQHLFKVTPADGVPKLFLFHALRDRMEQFRLRSQGTTMKHIKRSALTEVRTALPPPSVRSKFEEIVTPLDHLRLNLTTANQHLRATRDLLLPRLVSGEVDVTGLDLDLDGLVA